MKYDIILNVTNSCNYNCSYCNVIKWDKKISLKVKNNFSHFLIKNRNIIKRVKFFWWEPLLQFDYIKEIIDDTNQYIGKNYEIVTNTSLLNDKIGIIFSKYFDRIFFSIDSENIFSYEKIEKFINSYNLKDKVYFNIIISPNCEEKAFLQFKKLYELWFYNFNLLPIYFTKIWTKKNLINLSKFIKDIIDFFLLKRNINLFGFQRNAGHNTSLIDKALFINFDGKIYYSDVIVSQFWKKYKKELFLWNISSFSLLDFSKLKDKDKFDNILKDIEEKNYNTVKWQRELHKIMDYFSIYLNSKDNI